MYGLQAVILSGVVGLILGAIIAYVVTSADKDRTIDRLKAVHQQDEKNQLMRASNSEIKAQVALSMVEQLKAGRVSLNVSLYDPTTGGLARSETFENLVTGFAFVKQNRVWDQYVSIVRQNQTRVTIVIEAR